MRRASSASTARYTLAPTASASRVKRSTSSGRSSIAFDLRSVRSARMPTQSISRIRVSRRSFSSGRARRSAVWSLSDPSARSRRLLNSVFDAVSAASAPLGPLPHRGPPLPRPYRSRGGSAAKREADDERGGRTLDDKRHEHHSQADLLDEITLGKIRRQR